MDSELEQQLIDFLLNNRDYNKKFIADLFNILKCHPGVFVKPHSNAYLYYLVTTNFIIRATASDNCWKTDIIYKLRKFSYDIDYYVCKPIFSYLCGEEFEALRYYYQQDDFYKFNLHMSCDIKPLNYVNNIEWLFTTNQVKSARNINQLEG